MKIEFIYNGLAYYIHYYNIKYRKILETDNISNIPIITDLRKVLFKVHWRYINYSEYSTINVIMETEDRFFVSNRHGSFKYLDKKSDIEYKKDYTNINFDIIDKL